MIKKIVSLALTMVVVASGAALAAQIPSASPPPPPVSATRIKQFTYGPDAIYVLPTAFGVQLMIRFSADEQIENVSIGDGAAWQVTPNKAATLLFVKPVEMSLGTNMTVVTNQRAYLFELVRAANALDAPYLAKFEYPAVNPPAQTKAHLERRNTAYVFSGASANLPAEVFDDGQVTYFRWPEATATPAVFSVSADGVESLVNYSLRDGYQVVETIAPRFLLRNGATVTTVSNQGWKSAAPPAPGGQP